MFFLNNQQKNVLDCFILNLLFVSDTDDTFNCEFHLKAPLTQSAGTADSDKFYMKNVLWHLSTYASRSFPGYFAIRLSYDATVEFKFKINYSVKMMSTVDKKYDISHHWLGMKFTLANNFLGWPKFVTLADLKDEKKGLMKDGMIKVKFQAKFVE